MKLNVKSIIHQQERLNTRNSTQFNITTTLNIGDSKLSNSKLSKGSFLNYPGDDETYYIKNEEVYRRGAFSLSPKRNLENMLPPQKISHIKQKTLVLDLDETLIHSTFDSIQNPDLVFSIDIEGNFYQINVMIRPGAEEFLIEMSKYYELVIYTASVSKYADPVISLIDKQKKVSHRLFREHCTQFDGNYIKDLGKLGRDLKGVIIIDNCPESYYFNTNNGIPIKSWYDDKSDSELFKLKNVMIYLNNCFDVRGEIIKFVHENKICYDIFKNLEQKEKLKKTQRNVDVYINKTNPSLSMEYDDSIDIQKWKNDEKMKHTNHFKQSSKGKNLLSLVLPSSKPTPTSFINKISDLKKFNSNQIQKQNYYSHKSSTKSQTSLKKPEFLYKTQKHLKYDLNTTTNCSNLETTANNNTLNKTTQNVLKNQNQSIDIKSGENRLRIVKSILNNSKPKEMMNKSFKHNNSNKQILMSTSRNAFANKNFRVSGNTSNKNPSGICKLEQYETNNESKDEKYLTIEKNPEMKKTHIKQNSVSGTVKPLISKVKIKSPLNSNYKIENETIQVAENKIKKKNKSYDFKNFDFDLKNKKEKNSNIPKAKEKKESNSNLRKNSSSFDKKYFKFTKIKKISLDPKEKLQNPINKFKNELIDNPILSNHVLRSNKILSRDDTPYLKTSNSVNQNDKLLSNFISISSECNSPNIQIRKTTPNQTNSEKKETIFSLKKSLNRKF